MTSIKNWQIWILTVGSIFGTVCYIIWMLHGFKLPTWGKSPLLSSVVVVKKPKKPSLAKLAKAKAEAEYQCAKVKVLGSSVKIVRLKVCGKLRWYDCSGYSCSEVRHKDAHTWARYKPAGTWAFTGCKELKGGTLMNKRCTFITNTLNCWVCKGGYRP